MLFIKRFRRNAYIFHIIQMRTNSFVGDKLTAEIVRRQQVFSSFMESFNTGIALPPVMAKMHNRVTAIEEKLQTPKDSVPTVVSMPVKENVEDLIETVDEHTVTRSAFEAKAENTIKELTVMVSALDKLVNEKLKKVDLLNTSIIQLNKTLEETINRVHTLENRVVTPASTDVTGDFATKQELKDTEKRIVKDLTDKIDAEMIDAEERFTEKLKTSIESIKDALEETVGEEEDDEENEEEDDVDGVIDMD